MNKVFAVVRVGRRHASRALVAGGSALGAAASFAQTADPGTSITSASTTILGYVAIFGAAAIAIALAGVGWKVGVKFVKRLAGAA